MRPLPAGWRPRLVVLDLDGTVVRYEPEPRPSARVCAAVAAILAADVRVVVATGRSVSGALPIAAALGLHGIELVCSNGAVVYDPETAAPLHEMRLDPRPAVEALSALEPAAEFAAERADLTGFLATVEFGAELLDGVVTRVDREAIAASPTVRLVCRVAVDHPGWAPHAGAAARAAELVRVLDPALYSGFVGYSGWIDVNAAGVSKAHGVAMLAADLEIDPADVLAIGDGRNDLELFAWAGHAVAMGQAPEIVRAAADEITDSVEDDGAAVVLERWFG